ncbi:MAG TPA: response regulator, partial [Longimicrobiales bacterium]|nr:response regulator [Longimicrobiales bacterium]
MGDEPLNILLVEDNDADIALVRKLLLEGFSTSPIVLVRRSLSGAIIALRENVFDAVILDLGLPDSWGIRSLERLRKTEDHVPIVVLTALDDDEVGREAIAAGADDYLLKDERSSALLARSIRYSIERTSIRRRMRKSEERFRALVENISDAVLMLDDGEVRYVTPSIRNLLGYVPSDWSPQEFVKVFHPDERDTVKRALRSVSRAPGAKVSLECRTHHVGGGWR